MPSTNRLLRDEGLRERVAAQLTRLTIEGHALAMDSELDTARRWQYRPGVWSIERLPLHRQLLEPYRHPVPTAAAEGRLAIITAGPAGGGKTTAVSSVLGDLSGWIRIDPDEFKKDLVLSLIDRTEYQAQMARVLADGQPVMPLELASLVHQESAYLAGRAQAAVMASGHNLIIEGTPTWPELASKYALQIARYSYEHLDVIDVHTPRAIAQERTLTRWWLGRLDDGGSGLGGRFTPPAALDRSYNEQGKSACSAVAHQLVDLTNTLGVTTGLITVGDDTSPAQEEERAG
jgi:chloramphenicol 3-O-phosphotransferase